MAEERRMTAAQVVDKLMASEHADVVRESVAWVVTELMEAEVAGQIGADIPRCVFGSRNRRALRERRASGVDQRCLTAGTTFGEGHAGGSI